MTTRQLIENVAQHLLQQGEQSLLAESVNNGNGCAYRSADGLQCAVGCLIKPEVYAPELEGHSCLEDPVIHALEQSLNCSLHRNSISLEVLSDLQTIHDNYEPAEWEERITKYVRSLDYDILEANVGDSVS